MNDDFDSRLDSDESGAPEWVVTFGDLMSLLLCFFVLLLSFSEIDRQKYKIVAGSLAKAFGIQRREKVFDSPQGVKMIALSLDQELIPQHEKEAFLARQPLESVGEEIREQLKNHLKGLENRIEIEVEGNQTVIRLTGETTFDSGKAEIRPQLMPLLTDIGSRLGETEGDLIIAGHTDNVPVSGGRFKNNLQLSIARAAEVAEFMIHRVGVEPRRISTMGFGMYRPIDTNETAKGRERNRRVEIILTALPPPEVSDDDTRSLTEDLPRSEKPDDAPPGADLAGRARPPADFPGD
ncbi:MAG: flagellar motor protein MotB [Desulfobacterales bacterium]